jgi:hypothetical protein
VAVTAEPAESRRTKLVEAVKRSLVLAAVAAVALALVGAVFAAATDRNVSATIAATYYIVGCVLFLIGMFPSGGFSIRRGTMTPRKPIGSRLEPIILAGILLVGLGVAADITRPI